MTLLMLNVFSSVQTKQDGKNVYSYEIFPLGHDRDIWTMAVGWIVQLRGERERELT